MKNALSVLIKPASSNCNLQCSYCFYHDVSNHRKNKSYGMMTLDTAKKIIDRLIESTSPTAHITIGFQGGEPTLVGLPFFKEFIRYAASKKEKRTFHYNLQTNGVLLDEKWCKFFKRNNFLIGLSLDGYEGNMNKFRRDIHGLGVFSKVMDSYKLLQKNFVDTNLLCVLTNSLAKAPKELYSFFNSIKASHVQLIPCLPPLNGCGAEALTPNNYNAFYQEFYSLWLKDFKRGNAMSVNLFDNVLLMLMRRAPFQCGINGRCSVQNIIEADGSLFACDFYVTDEHNLGNVHTHSFEAMENCTTALEFQKPLDLPPLCQHCKYVRVCNGGCKRQRVCFLEENSCSYSALLDSMMVELPKVLNSFMKTK